MKYYLTLLFVLFFCDLFSQDTIRKIHGNGELKMIGYKIDGKKTGIWETYDEEGNLLKKQEYKNDLKDGIWEKYSLSVLSKTGNFKGGKRNGVFKSFYAGTNKIRSSEKIIDDILIDTVKTFFGDGKMASLLVVNTGSYVKLFRDGSTQENGHYALPVKESTSEKFMEIDGKKSFYFEYNDKIGKWSTFFQGGAIESEKNYDNDNLISLKNYYQEGTIRHKISYHPKKKPKVNYFGEIYVKNGKIEFFYPNGNLKEKGEFIGDERDGIWYYYHDNGQVSIKCVYEKGKLMNIYSKYLKNGKKVDFGNLTDGNGEVFNYDDSGKIISVDKLKNGEFIKK